MMAPTVVLQRATAVSTCRRLRPGRGGVRRHRPGSRQSPARPGTAAPRCCACSTGEVSRGKRSQPSRRANESSGSCTCSIWPGLVDPKPIERLLCAAASAREDADAPASARPQSTPVSGSHSFVPICVSSVSLWNTCCGIAPGRGRKSTRPGANGVVELVQSHDYRDAMQATDRLFCPRSTSTASDRRRTRGVEAPGTADWAAVCADARKTPPQGDARRFGEPHPDGRNDRSRSSRAVRQPEDRCGSAIGRAILFL